MYTHESESGIIAAGKQSSRLQDCCTSAKSYASDAVQRLPAKLPCEVIKCVAQGHSLLGSVAEFPIRQVGTLGTIPHFPDTSPRFLFHGAVALELFRLSRVAVSQALQ